MQYVASISYGKDSLAMLHVIKDVLHKPLDRIVTADVWATDDIPADLPPMVEFKIMADKIIEERWGLKVEHFHATKKNGEKQTYDKCFHRIHRKSGVETKNGGLWGFPYLLGPWCNSELKIPAIRKINKICGEHIDYLGIAIDETERVVRHLKRENVELPLVEAEWTEAKCREWCEKNGLLSPTYSMSTRDGCWFCHNQGAEQLRLLRKQYPDLWAMMLKWDDETPEYAKFKPGRTVHDYERRFQLEDEGYMEMGEPFKWSNLKEAQMNVFQFVPDPDRKDSA